jgi:general secretion pathway protein A
MNNKQLLSRYALKWNPFGQEVPIEGIAVGPDMENFCFRVENLVLDGGFGMITGPVGTGKSLAMRFLAQRLEKIQDLKIAEIARPQSKLVDFYRELGEEFGLDLKPSNHWGGYRSLRSKWQAHIASTLFRPVIFVDEAQDMPTEVLNELRLMSSSRFDSVNILTVILAGDERLPERFRTPALLPLGSRIKTRLVAGHRSREELLEIIKSLVTKAGNPSLMSPDLMATLADKAMGNCRAMTQMAEQLLLTGIRRDLPQLDEQLFIELFSVKNPKRKTRKK